MYSETRPGRRQIARTLRAGRGRCSRELATMARDNVEHAYADTPHTAALIAPQHAPVMTPSLLILMAVSATAGMATITNATSAATT
jgi:hypothetical protein